MPEYIDANGHLIISILKNAEGKCIRACFQPDRMKEMIKEFGGEVSVEQVEFVIEGDGMLMATLASQLMGGQGSPQMRPGQPGGYYPQPGLPFRQPSTSIGQPLSNTAVVDDDDDTDDDLDADDTDDDEDDDDTT
jgi:hypothetical protein